MTSEISLDFDAANATVEQLLAAADRIEAEGAVNPSDMASLRQQCGERYEPFLQQHFQREYAREDAYKRVAAKLRADAERKRNTAHGFQQHDEDSASRIAALDETNGIAPNGYGRMDDFQGGMSQQGIQPNPDAPDGKARTIPAGYMDPSPVDQARVINETPGDRPRGVFPEEPPRGIPPQPLPGQPSGPSSWAEVAPFPGDAKHPPHGGLIPSNQPPGYTEVDPWGKPIGESDWGHPSGAHVEAGR